MANPDPESVKLRTAKDEASGSVLAGKEIPKNYSAKLNPIAEFRSPQIPTPHLAPPCEGTFMQTANCTKMFHVKHFGTIACLRHSGVR
jgi:hypothetical protein